jgi:hypothetical protein
VNLIQNNESVLIQETEDNDGAYLISALAQLVLDPYYRTEFATNRIRSTDRERVCDHEVCIWTQIGQHGTSKESR